jgi:hypothetical protein
VDLQEGANFLVGHTASIFRAVIRDFGGAESMFILEHNFRRNRLLLFVKHLAVCPDKEVSNKTTVHQLVTKFRVDASVREGDGFF